MATQVHHLNCGAMRPPGGALFDGVTPGLGSAALACHCLLLEVPDGLVLVDAGVVGQDARQSRAAHHPAFLAVENPRLDERESAAVRIRTLGLRPDDVWHIVMTHPDFDHAAGTCGWCAHMIRAGLMRHLCGTCSRFLVQKAGSLFV